MDPETIERAKAGDRQALAEVLEHHHAQIDRFLVQLVGPISEVDDLRQNVLMQVAQSLPRFRGDSSLASWIKGICVNISKAYFRSKKRHAGRSFASAEEMAERPSPEDPTYRLENRDALVRSETALSALSPEQRTAFVLAVHGHTVNEIATMTGAARSTTRLRLYYGRKKFFRELALDAAADERRSS